MTKRFHRVTIRKTQTEEDLTIEKKPFHQLFRSAVNKKGLKLEDLEKKYGHGKAYFSKLQTGTKTNPDFDLTIKLLRDFKIKPAQIELEE